MKRRVLGCTLGAALAVAAAARAAEPVDRDLIPEARAVLKYLEGVYGDKTLGAVHGDDNAGFVYEASGRLPAIVSFDLCGWNSPTWGKTYTPVVEGAIELFYDGRNYRLEHPVQEQ